MAEQEREDFWGCILSDKKKIIVWNGPSDANDDVLEVDISHRLVLSQACLGSKPKSDECNLIQATSLDAANNKLSVIIANMYGQFAANCPMNLTFSNPVSFELVQGSGPVHLSGNHIQVLSTFDMQESDSDDSESETEVAMAVDTNAKKPADKPAAAKREKAPAPKGPPLKKAKLRDEEESSVDSELEEMEEEKEDQEPKKEEKPESKEPKKEEKKEETKDKKVKATAQETKETKEPEKKGEDKKKGVGAVKGQKKGPVTLDDLVAEEEDSEDDEDFEGSEDESDDSEESDDNFELEDKDSDEDSDDEDDSEDDSDEGSSSDDSVKKKAQPTRVSPRKQVQNTESTGVSTRFQMQNGKMNATPKTTPAKGESKKAPVAAAAKTPTTPKAAAAAKKTPQGPADVETIKKTLLKTPNLPRKSDKFKNYMKSRFKLEDDKTINTLWDWLQKNKK